MLIKIGYHSAKDAADEFKNAGYFCIKKAEASN
jgi:hypothetical protein